MKTHVIILSALAYASSASAMDAPFPPHFYAQIVHNATARTMQRKTYTYTDGSLSFVLTNQCVNQIDGESASSSPVMSPAKPSDVIVNKPTWIKLTIDPSTGDSCYINKNTSQLIALLAEHVVPARLDSEKN